MKKEFKKIKEILFSNEIRILPGSLAYSFFMALIPLISLVFYVITKFNLPNDILHNFITSTFPKGVVDLLQPVFNSTITIKSFITICLGLFIAMNGCNAIIIASNTIYKFKNSSLFRRLIKSMFIILIIILLFAFIFVVPLLGRTILNLISTVTSFIDDNETIINRIYFILQVPVSMIIMFFVIKFVYIIAPDEKISSKYVNRGTLFTTISWMIATLIFSYYINNIAAYDAVYGNLANIVILLFYLYLLAYIFVIGMCLNKKNNENGIEKTNSIKLDEIRKKLQNNK